MSSPKKRRVQGGRVTPKGTQPRSNRQSVETVRELNTEPSPPWVTWLLFSLLAIGMLVIFLNYTKLLGGEVNNVFTLVGLGFILGGIITATRLR